MSSLIKKAGNVVKKVGKAVGNVLSGIGKVFKEIYESNIGKVVLAAAAIYVGGWALGAWGGPSTLLGGASSTGWTAGLPPGMEAAGGAQSFAAGPAAADVITRTAADAATGGELLASGGNVGAQLIGGGAGDAMAGGAGGIVSGMSPATQAMAGKGLETAMAGAPEAFGAAFGAENTLATGIVKSITGLAKWAGDHQLITAMALNAGAAALTPSPIEEAADQAKKDRARWAQNLNVGGLDTRLIRPPQAAPPPIAAPATAAPQPAIAAGPQMPVDRRGIVAAQNRGVPESRLEPGTLV